MKRRILISVMILSTLFSMFGCAKKPMVPVTSAEAMKLTVRGMHGGYVYDFAFDGDAAVLNRYREIYSGEATLLELEKSVPCGKDDVINLAERCGVMGWNGFHGKHPKNVSDGTMFIFEATLNGNQTVYADGSANYPEGYREFVNTLDSILAEIEKE